MKPHLNKAHSNGAHLGKLIDCLKAMIDWLSQKLSKLLVVENLKTTSTGDLADSGRMETVVVITVAALDKNAGVTETLCIYLPSHVVQVYAWLTKRQLVVRTFKPQLCKNKMSVSLVYYFSCCVQLSSTDLCQCVVECSQLWSYG